MFPSPEFSPIKDSLFRYKKTLVPFLKQMFQIQLVMIHQVFDIYILCIWRISLNVATSQASLTKKALTFFFVFFYGSQMVNFNKIYHFSRFQRGPTFSRGEGGPIAYSL